MIPRCSVPAIMPLLMLISTSLADNTAGPPGGELKIVDPNGQAVGACPLRHTDVQADISGFVSRVTVRQVFHNPLDRKIEAIYVFPLPQDAAVDDMVMTVGDRRIVGQIRQRDEARQIYEAARSAGHVASLLDEERPNIFTQSVANIEPGAVVEIEISYVDTLKYEDGGYQFVFPMVVGPRYIPGQPTSQVPAPSPELRGQVADVPVKSPGAGDARGRGWAPDTDQVPDASRITPPVVKPGMRAGHDIGLTVRLDAGIALQEISSALHEVTVDRTAPSAATITLNNMSEIPNRDFILNYRTAGDGIGDALLTHRGEQGGFFTLILQPPRRIVPQEVVPRELIFVLDTSGSMRGFPIEKAKEVMSRAIDAMRPRDTFNLITFAGRTRILWDQPRPNTAENRAAAQNMLNSQQGGGGTEMMRAIEAALVQTTAGAASLLTPEALADLPADGRAVVVRVHSTALLRWPPPNMRSHWQGTALRLNDGSVIEIRGIETAAAAMDLALHGRWETINRRRVLTVDHFERAGQQEFTGAPIRIVCFMTDGYVGNDMAIIDAVKNNARTTRVFSFGIGNSVNRFLLDGMARAGRGEVEYVNLRGRAEDSVARFHQRISAPVLTDIALDFGSLPVEEVYPRQIPDLFSARPLMVHGRLTGPPAGSVRLTGNTGAGRFERSIQLSPVSKPQAHPALASLWARAAIADLEMRDYAGMQQGSPNPEIQRQITELGLTYRLVTPFTSFVAVEELTVTAGGQPTTITVPVEMPDGVSHEGVFGKEVAQATNARLFMSGNTVNLPMPAARRVRSSVSARPAHKLELTPTSAGGVAGAPEDSAHSLSQRPDHVEIDESPDRPDAGPSKLEGALTTLAKKVADEGHDGNLTIGKLRVIDYRVDVMVYLSDCSPEVLEALARIGFTTTGESKAIRMVVGSIDVRKLLALAEVEAVLRITPLAL